MEHRTGDIETHRPLNGLVWNTEQAIKGLQTFGHETAGISDKLVSVGYVSMESVTNHRTVQKHKVYEEALYSETRSKAKLSLKYRYALLNDGDTF